MEIIKRGKIPEEKEYTRTCQWCDTIVKFKHNEAKSSCDPRENELYVECSLCKRWIFV